MGWTTILDHRWGGQQTENNLIVTSEMNDADEKEKSFEGQVQLFVEITKEVGEEHRQDGRMEE